MTRKVKRVITSTKLHPAELQYRQAMRQIASRRALAVHRRNEAIRLRAEGWSYREVGEEFGISSQRVGQIVKEGLE